VNRFAEIGCKYPVMLLPPVTDAQAAFVLPQAEILQHLYRR
jgi:hypothetical protein